MSGSQSLPYEALKAVEVATSGALVGHVFEENRATAVVVRLDPKLVARPEDLGAIHGLGARYHVCGRGAACRLLERDQCFPSRPIGTFSSIIRTEMDVASGSRPER